MSYHQSWHNERWQQPSPGSDYASMSSMGYETRTLPSSNTNSIQRATMTSQYALPTTYADSPDTPLSASSYTGSQAHYGGYHAYSYQVPSSATSYVDQIPMHHSQRPMAPMTPPLEDDHATHYHQRRPIRTVKSTTRRSPTGSMSTVKQEPIFNEGIKDIKECPMLTKEDGTLQNKFEQPMDVLLATLELKKDALPLSLPIRRKETTAATPESMASPAPSEGSRRPQPKKDKQCIFCPAKFTQNAQLKTHERMHTGEKRYQCDICGKYVSQPGNLTAHRRRHTGEQPFECEICHVRFAANGSRKNHMSITHGGEPKKPCPIPACTRTFTTIGNMKVHLNKHHIAEIAEYMEMIKSHDPSKPFPQDNAEMWGKLLCIYKNSNRGIKGRGIDSKEMKQFDKDYRKMFKEKARAQQVTPISPDPSHSIQDYPQYYSQNEQQHYSARTQSTQQPQQQSGYMQQLPMHQPQTTFHGLPQPTPYSMGGCVAPLPQYLGYTPH